MTGRRYYITTLADWHRYAHRFANSHWLALDDDATRSRESTDASCAVRADGSDAVAHDAPPFDAGNCDIATVGARHAVPEPADGTAAPSSGELSSTPVIPSKASAGSSSELAQPIRADTQSRNLSSAPRILVLIDADEGVHLALEDDAAFEALPHPFAPKSISDAAQQALAPHGVTPGATTFDAAEAASRAHPLLLPRVF